MLTNQVAIVTGASRGIGKAVAFQLAEQGAKLALAGSSEGVYETEKELKEKGFSYVKAFQVDVANEQQMQKMVTEVLEEFGQIDILVNNAGIGFFKEVEETTVEEWERIFAVNVQGVFIGVKAVLPHMKE